MIRTGSYLVPLRPEFASTLAEHFRLHKQLYSQGPRVVVACRINSNEDNAQEQLLARSVGRTRARA